MFKNLNAQQGFQSYRFDPPNAITLNRYYIITAKARGGKG